jgi:hypothetical protein
VLPAGGAPYPPTMNFGVGGGHMMTHQYPPTLMPVNQPPRPTVVSMMTRPPQAVVGDANSARVLSSGVAQQSMVEQQMNQVVSI